MRSPSALALVLALTGVGAACGGEGSGPSNVPPTAAFLPSCTSLVCTFADASADADGEISSYSWDFGDGAARGTTRDAQHTYATASSYAVTLTVTDNDDAVSAVTEAVEATVPPNAPPTAGFTASCAVLACSFTDASTDGDGSVVGYQWDFGDGSEAATPSADHRYATAGTYTVALTVTDDGGATGALVRQLTVAGPAGEPTADFAGSCRATGHIGRSVFYQCVFTDQSTAVAGATLKAWAWDFGDGAGSTEQSPVHHYTRSYRAGGTVSFSPTLTVTDDRGRTNEVTKVIPLK